jgi:predicted RNA-binding Zn-ribbon protein involved in translation (DUF1610 family)
MKIEIGAIRRLTVECRRCGTEVVMNVDTDNTASAPYQCCVCGLDFGIDRMDDVYHRLQKLIRSSRAGELKAKFSLICEEEER